MTEQHERIDWKQVAKYLWRLTRGWEDFGEMSAAKHLRQAARMVELHTIIDQQQQRIAELERKLEASTLVNVSAANAAYRDVDTIERQQARIAKLEAALEIYEPNAPVLEEGEE